MNPSQRLATLSVCAIAASLAAQAQSNEDISSILQFNFENPGARSLGMAGAFTARADDATAVYANPAGLIQLSRPEISVEGRGWQFFNRFVNGGQQIDRSSLAGLEFAETDDSAEGLAFFSAFYPARSGRWVVGLFRHQAVNFETAMSTQDAQVLTANGTGFARPRDGVLDLSVDTVGASFAVRLARRFSIGATVTSWNAELHSRLELYDAPRDQDIGSPSFPISLDDPFPGITEADPEICCEFGNRGDIIRLRTQDGEDDGFDFALGLFWESKTTREGVPLVAAGAVYRSGPKFEFTGKSYLRSLTSSTLPTTRRFAPVFTDARGVFKTPDVFGAGISLRPSKRWVISADYARVQYGDLMDEFLDLAARDSAIPNGETGRPVDYFLDDGDEYRLGFEYVVNPNFGEPLFFLRWGAWHDPNHEIEYVGPSIEQRPIFSPGADEIHHAFGGGLKFHNLQIDAGLDLSDRLNTFSLSAVFYLGRD